MTRTNPIVRALCEQLRRPAAKQILAGLVLMIPAGLMTMRDGKMVDLQPTTAPIFMAPVEAVAPAAEPDERSRAVATVYAEQFKIPASLALTIHQAATKAGVSPNIAFGLVHAESRFKPTAISPVGAVGLTQLMPQTAKYLAPGTTKQDLKNPRLNLRLGFTYLKSLIDRYDGNEKLALTAFNRGPGTVDKLLKRGRNPDNGYAQLVLTGKSAKHEALMNKKFHKKKST
jgi:soluble lytic murein transglycosylase-like protein